MVPKFEVEGLQLVFASQGSRVRGTIWSAPSPVSWGERTSNVFFLLKIVPSPFTKLNPKVLPLVLTAVEVFRESDGDSFVVRRFGWTGFAWSPLNERSVTEVARVLNGFLESHGQDLSTIGVSSRGDNPGSIENDPADLIRLASQLESLTQSDFENRLKEIVSSWSKVLPEMRARAAKSTNGSEPSGFAGESQPGESESQRVRREINEDLDGLLVVDREIQALLDQCLEVQRLLNAPILSPQHAGARHLRLSGSNAILEIAGSAGRDAADLLFQIRNTRQTLHEAIIRLDSAEQGRARREEADQAQAWRDQSEVRTIMRDEFAQRFGVLLVVFGAGGPLLNSLSSLDWEWSDDFPWTGLRFGATGILVFALVRIFEMISVERPQSDLLNRHNRFVDRLDYGVLVCGVGVLVVALGSWLW